MTPAASTKAMAMAYTARINIIAIFLILPIILGSLIFLGDEVDIDNFQNTGGIDDKQNNKPTLVAGPRGFPKRDALPDYAPNSKNRKKNGKPPAVCSKKLVYFRNRIQIVRHIFILNFNCVS
jgi:hypothetical protein